LNQAANVNNLEVARMLLAKGANVNIADNGGFTPLHGAATNAYRGGALVKLLLEHGAAVNAKSDDTAEVGFNGPIAIGDITPLMDAAQMGGYESVEALLKAGADPNAMDVRDANALVFAVAVDHPNPKVVQLLLAKSSDKDMAREWAWRNQNPAILPLFGLKPTPAPAASAAQSRTNPREAISRALAVTQPVAGKFLHNGGCSSCHSQYLNGMAVGAARSAGVKTEPALENEDTRATLILRGSLQEAFFEAQEPGDSSEAVGFALLQLASAGVPQSLAIDSMVHHMAAMQRKEGDWQTFEGRPPDRKRRVRPDRAGYPRFALVPYSRPKRRIRATHPARRRLGGKGRTAHHGGSDDADPRPSLGWPHRPRWPCERTRRQTAHRWRLGPDRLSPVGRVRYGRSALGAA
jgi:hypothetical protein